MREHDSLIGAYSHLESLPRAADALHMLQKIASLVKPIMRKRDWHVGTLTEFVPAEDNLLGLNINGGEKICLRLRHVRDKTLFKSLEEVTDTMLHELCHIVHGPHDSKFHALWNELRDEYIDLKSKGYSGEGFLSEGKRLGGRGVPTHEMRRQARIQAERRRNLQAGSGQKLGGAPVLRGTDMRRVIADAVERRNRITQGCASGTVQADDLARQATNNGFKTRAEEDDANDRAIAQALWELIQDEEDRNAGLEPELWVRGDAPPVDTNRPPPVPVQSRPKRPKSPQAQGSGYRDWNVLKPRAGVGEPRRLISEEEARLRGREPEPARPLATKKAPSTSSQRFDPPEQATSSASWACNTCTLVNRPEHLACDACGSQRPIPPTPPRPAPRQLPNTTGSRVSNAPPVAAKPALHWYCRVCGSQTESMFWSCVGCGHIKESS